METSHKAITARLLDLNRLIEGDVLLFPAATDLVQTDPYAFCLATCLDRSTKAEIIWTIPYWIREDLGLTPYMLHSAAEVYRLVTDTELSTRTPEDPWPLPGLQEIIVALAGIM